MSDPLSDPNSDPIPTHRDEPSDAQPERGSGPAHRDPYEGAVPPGYDWPTHGGYLGCLLGLMAACLIGGFAGKLVGLFTFSHNITGAPNVLLILGTILVAAFALGRVGWVLGRRFYREYSVKPTWGEDDAYRPEWEIREGADTGTEGGDAAEDADSPAQEVESTARDEREPLAEDAPANQGA